MTCRLFFRFLFFGMLITTGMTPVFAQQTIQGTIVHASTGEAVENATIQLLSGHVGTFAGYGITNAKGAFNIRSNRTDSLRIVVSALGYKTHQQAVNLGETLYIQLEEEAFVLQEVTVRPGRVWSRRDTLNYEVEHFVSTKDRTIRDVLEKLPGIGVDDRGQISYLGKNISNFYVEGMDLVGGRYNQITNNLRVEAVQTVQVLENHQPVRLLEDLVASEDIALNLKLKAEFQATWMFTLEGGIGMSPLLWKSADNAIRLSRTNQSLFSYKGNNTGNDVTVEQSALIFRLNSFMGTPSTPSFLSMPSIMAPLKKERLLFNDVHAFSANRMYKLNETTKMRINANLTYDERTQERGGETIYYFAGDSTRISEMSSAKLYSDGVTLNVHIENNASDKYLTNNFSVYGNRNSGLSNFSGSEMLTSAQRLQIASSGLNNNFRSLWGKKAYRYEVRSLWQYDRQPEELLTDRIEQKTLLNRFYTDNSFSMTGQNSYFVPQYTIGFSSDMNNLQSIINPYITTDLQWNKAKWQTRLSLPVAWISYLGADFSRLSIRPSAHIAYKLNYAWRFTLSAGYREIYGNILSFYQVPYYADYRRIVHPPEHLSVQQIQNYALSGEYKKTVDEFFASFTLSYMQSRNSHVYEQQVEDGYISSIPRELSNRTTAKIIAGTLSKGFYDIRLNTSLTAQFIQNEGEQFSQNATLPFLSNRMMLEPKLNWMYWRNLDISYMATINLAGSKIGERVLDPLWTVLQKLQLSYTLQSVEVNCSVDHYYNNVTYTNAVNHFFVDFSFRYRQNKWQLSAELNNLFNKRQYGYSEYSEIRSYSSWMNIRGREFIASAQFKF